jgi:hypothetical protein
MTGLRSSKTTEALQTMRERGESLSDVSRVKREALQGVEPDISGVDAPDLGALRIVVRPRSRPGR